MPPGLHPFQHGFGVRVAAPGGQAERHGVDDRFALRLQGREGSAYPRRVPEPLARQVPFHHLAPRAGLGGFQGRPVAKAVRERPVSVHGGHRPQRYVEPVQRHLRELEAPCPRRQSRSVGGPVSHQRRRVGAFGRVDAGPALRLRRGRQRHGPEEGRTCQLPLEQVQHSLPGADTPRGVLEGGVSLVVFQGFDHLPVTADFRVAHGDAPVEPFVRRDTGRTVRQVKFDHVAREQNPPVAQVQDGVPVKMPPRVVERHAGNQFQAPVVGMVDAQSVRPREVRPLDGDGFRRETLLDLPQAAVGVRV